MTNFSKKSLLNWCFLSLFVFSGICLAHTKKIIITKGEDIAIANPAAVQQQVKEPNKGDATTLTIAGFKC